MNIKHFVKILVWLIVVINCNVSFGNTPVKIRGMVTDAATGQALSSVTIELIPKNLGIGVLTENDGNYVVPFDVRADSIAFSYIGYERIVLKMSNIKNEILNIKLKRLSYQLNEMVVVSTRERYRNKDNPAVILIRKAIANKDNNRIESHETYQYDRYERLQLSLNELKDSVRDGFIFRKFPFLNNYLDTSKQTGDLSLPIFLRETMSEHYFRKSPKSEKEYLLASKMANFNDFIEPQTISTIMDGLVGKPNIYDNSIMILDNEYMSPMSPLAPNFYYFFILDTLDINGVNCINLSFYPRNPQDFGFSGNVYLTNDSIYALKRAELTFTQKTNVNFVNNFSLVQEYSFIDSTWCMTLDEATIDFSYSEKKNLMLGKRINTYTNYDFNKRIPESIFYGINKLERTQGYDMRANEFWTERRPIPLLHSEQGVYDMLEDMKNDKWFNGILKVVGIVFSGYYDAGKFDIGPIESFLSFNEVEGTRFRFGGKTNARLNKHLFFEGFGAYGFKDEKFKYQVGSMYSFNERKLHPWEYPINLLSVSYEDNIETPGQFFLFGSGDRLLLSIHRGHAQQMVYHRTFNVDYQKEFKSGFSIQPSFIHRKEVPAGNLIFANAYGNVDNITSSRLGLKLRFAPNERFYQVQHNRFPLNHTNPVFYLNYAYGIKNLWEGDYNFHRLEAGIDKRYWFSTLGFADIWLKAGKIWGTVPFSLLVIHQANQNYAYQDEAFNMMNYMEFVSDQYASVNLSYCFNGFIFNRTPLIKKLKWREYLTFKALWGKVSDRNLPENNPDLLRFPTNSEGIPTMYSLLNEPYMEASVAIDNIFKILRIDLVKRINYLNHPDIPEWGIRFRARFVF